jgi:GTP1/Obg family GTP-binding protein
MATRDQRLAARRRAREIQAEDKKKIEDMLRRKREATEEVLVRLSQVDEVHAAAGQALQTLVDMGDQKDSLAETFGLPKSAVDGYIRAWRSAEDRDAGSDEDESTATGESAGEGDDAGPVGEDLDRDGSGDVTASV